MSTHPYGARTVNPEDHTTMKIILAWVGATYGAITLSHLVLFATLIFTVVQTYFVIRDKWWRDPRRTNSKARRRRASDHERYRP